MQKNAYSIKDFTARKSQLLASNNAITKDNNTLKSTNINTNDPITLPFNSKELSGVGLYTVEGRLYINDIDGARPIVFATKQTQILETQAIDNIQNEINCLKNMMQDINPQPCNSYADLSQKIEDIAAQLKQLAENSTSIAANNQDIAIISDISKRIEELAEELAETKEEIEEIHDTVAADKENSEEINKEVSGLKEQIDKYNYELALSKAHESSLSDRLNILDKTLLKTSTVDDLELIRQQISLFDAKLNNMSAIVEEIEQKYFLLNERVKTLEQTNGTTHFEADLVCAGDIVMLEESGKLRPISISSVLYKIEGKCNFVHFDELLLCFSDKKIDIYDARGEHISAIEHEAPFCTGDPIIRYENDSHLIYCSQDCQLYVLDLGDSTLKPLLSLPQLGGATPWLNYNAISNLILVMWRPIAGLAYFCISEQDSGVVASAIRQLAGGTNGAVKIESIPHLHISLAAYDNKIAVINPRGANDIEIIENYKDMDAASIIDVCITSEGNIIYLAENLVGCNYVALCDILGNEIRMMHEIELNNKGCKKICLYRDGEYVISSDSSLLVVSAANNILSVKYEYCGYFNDATICCAPLYVAHGNIITLGQNEEYLSMRVCSLPGSYDFIGIACDSLGNIMVRGQIYETTRDVFLPGKKYYINLKKIGAVFPDNLTTLAYGNVYFGISIGGKKLLISNI